MAASSTLRLLTEDELQSTQAHTFAELKNRLDERRNHVQRQIGRIVEVDAWQGARRTFNETQNAWNNSTNTWQQHFGQNNFPSAAKALRELDRALTETEERLASAIQIAELPVGMQLALRELETRMLNAIATRQAEFHAVVQKGIDELHGVKREVVLTRSFGKHVATLKSSARRSCVWNLFGIGIAVVALVCAEAFAGGLHQGGDWVGELMLRVAMAGPLAFLIYFFLYQHRIARLLELKYQHLEGFLGGGARELIEMIATDDSRSALSDKLYEHLADSFVRIDDVTHAVNRSQTPMEDALKALQAMKAFKEK
jgi:hypothetical protein